MVIANVQCVVLDCPDVLELAEFYQALLGGAVNPPERLVQARGCRRLDDGANFWRIYADPAGHPFCLLQEKSA